MCKILGINFQSKYVKGDLENCKAYNEFLKLEGVIKIGENVVIPDSKGTVNGTLKDINPDGSIIITLHPWDNDVDYKSISAENMAHWEPELDSYNRNCRSYGIPQYWKKN